MPTGSRYFPSGEGEKGATQRFAVEHDGVSIALSRGGRGRPVVLCPGLLSTQADLHDLAGSLRGDFDVVTFDLRGHGRSSRAERYRFSSFLGDLEAVMSELERASFSSPPLLVGHSLGADLIVHYAAEHPGAVAGPVLIDARSRSTRPRRPGS